MKNTKHFLYALITLVSCTIASQQYAMDTSKYGNIKISNGAKHRAQARQEAEKARQAAEAAEEKRRFDEALFNKNNPVLGQFIREFKENGIVQQSPATKSATEQRSAETSPLPFPNAAIIQAIALKHSDSQTSTPTTELMDCQTSTPTQRAASPFRVIITTKDRSDSPFALAMQGKDSPFKPKDVQQESSDNEASSDENEESCFPKEPLFPMDSEQ